MKKHRLIFALPFMLILVLHVGLCNSEENKINSDNEPTVTENRRFFVTDDCESIDSVLNCSGSSLESVPHPPSQRSFLELDISNNVITSLLTDIHSYHSIVHLSAQHNRITTLDEGNLWTVFPKLHSLNVSDNYICHLPENLPKDLKVLDLGRNKIAVNDCININTFLEEIYLNENKIDGTLLFCRAHDNGKNLAKMDLSKNNIKNVDPVSLGYLKSLQVFSIADNNLEYLYKNSFRGLSFLYFLDLSRNRLRVLERGIFEHLPSLKFLYLQGNKLHTVPSPLPLLDWLDISHNEISTVNETLRGDVYPIEMVNLGHNPFHCDCHLLWLKEWYDRREYILEFSEDINPEEYIPGCATPKAVAGELWSTLADDLFVCEPDTATSESDECNLPSEMNSATLEEEELHPYSVPGENPKYIQSFDLDVQIRSVQATSVTIEWRAPARYTNLLIQYFKIEEEIETTLFSQVQASQGHFILRGLEPRTAYMICLMPKTEMLSLTSSVEDCIQVHTSKPRLAAQPSLFDGLLNFQIDYTLESRFRLIANCFLVSLVVVAAGLLLTEGIIRLCTAARKEHSE